MWLAAWFQYRMLVHAPFTYPPFLFDGFVAGRLSVELGFSKRAFSQIFQAPPPPKNVRVALAFLQISRQQHKDT